jgi:hypothetical protein
VAGGCLANRFGAIPSVLSAYLLTGLMAFIMHLASFLTGMVSFIVLLGICRYSRTLVSEAYILSKASSRHRSTSVASPQPEDDIPFLLIKLQNLTCLGIHEFLGGLHSMIENIGYLE